MDRLTSALSLLLLVAVTVTHAAATAPQLAYWHSVLPNTPIPSALVDLLNFDVDASHMKKQSVAAMNVKDRNWIFGWYTHRATEKPSVAAMNVKDRNALFNWYTHRATENNALFNWYTHRATEKPSVAAMNVKDHNQLFNWYTHRNQLFNWYTHRATEKPSVAAMNVKDRNALFNWYTHRPTENHIDIDGTNGTVFFLKDDLRIGAEINLRFTKTTTSKAVGFLPREQADSIPFSSARLTEILNYFSVEPGCPEANAMAETLNQCDVSGVVEGEKKYCATSLESMVEFCVSILGGGTNNIKAASTNVPKSGTPSQKYTVTETKPTGDEVVQCHRLTYLYPVFGCHALPASSSYAMTLVGVDGSTVEAMAMCHADTSAWDPNHLAFKVLKVKPGATVCHVMPEQDIVWSREDDAPTSTV